MIMRLEEDGIDYCEGQKDRPLPSANHHTVDINKTNDASRKLPPCDMSLSEYTPCQHPPRGRKFDRDMLKYRERHCPTKEELLLCLIPAPPKYKTPFKWPQSRDYAWYDNIPHRELSIEKAVQNWIQVEGDRFRFPGGGTMFPRGADAYIDDINELIPLTNGAIRTAIDTGCGVASWGAYLLKRNIVTMSFAPRDTHEAQVQFALERGVPAMIGIMASQRLPYPARAFDMAHCSRCLIPWHQYNGMYLIEVDRVLRPGGYWVLSGPPINWKKYWRGWERSQEDLKGEQDAIEDVAKRLCWKKVAEKNDLSIWQKPINHVECVKNRKVYKTPHMCKSENPDASWYKNMETCITPMPDVSSPAEVAGGKLEKWPERAFATPPRISSGSIPGISAEKFREDNQVWKERLTHYKRILPLQQGRYRNIMDMNAHLGGFAAALAKYPVWVMNVVPANSDLDTLGVIYERGFIGAYQDWCEAFSTYPRTYDLIHAGGVFSIYQDRCDITYVLLEMDRILRPEGTVIFRDTVEILLEEDLHRTRCLLADGDAASFLPAKAHGRFLRMFLGPINVRASRKDIQLKVKEEYNSYRDRTALLFLLFPFILLILRSWKWDGCLPAFPVQLYQAWLLFLYTGLALRENILRANGSDIRPWWIYHHYCAMLMALVSLTWEIKGQPNCSQKQRGVQLFLIWAMMQGVAMLLQNRYQRQRLYTRIALGKAKRMDVVWGETAGVDGQLWVLCPILFILQGFEAYVGLLLLRTALDGVVSEWQVMYSRDILWDPFGANGNWELCKYSTDTDDKIKVQGKNEKKQEQA
uniref:Methyltransferase n=1 Tax=Cannabis sativa TaxID=3483 RepID=A0A803PPH5_CANSA